MKKVKLFSSNRKGVEQLFKYSKFKETAESDGSRTVYYDIQGTGLDIIYLTGKCLQHKSPLGYNVEKDTVIDVYIRLFKGIKVRDTDLNLSLFEKTRSDAGIIFYENDSLGIKIEGSEKWIGSINFYPSAAQEKDFRCTNLSN